MLLIGILRLLTFATACLVYAKKAKRSPDVRSRISSPYALYRLLLATV